MVVTDGWSSAQTSHTSKSKDDKPRSGGHLNRLKPLWMGVFLWDKDDNSDNREENLAGHKLKAPPLVTQLGVGLWVQL